MLHERLSIIDFNLVFPYSLKELLDSMASLTRRVAQNAAYQTLGKAVSVILGAVAFSVMARYLGEERFGEYTTITTFAVFFSTMADMGFYYIAVRDISKPDSNEAKIFGNAFTLRLIATVFFVLLAPIVAHFFFDYSDIVELGILVAALSTFFISVNQILVAIFQKHLRTDQVALMEVISRVVFLGLVFYLAYSDYGVISFVWATGISSLINFVLLYLASRKLLPFLPKFEISEWRNIMKAAWPIALVIIINLFYFRFNVILLSVMKPAADVGIFGAAYKIIEILIALPAIFVGLIIPILSRYIEQDKQKFRDVFQRAFNALILVAVPIAVGTQFIAGFVIDLVGGAGFEESAHVLQILIVAVLAMFLSSLAINTIVVLNKQKAMIIISTFAAVTSIIMNLVLIPRYSYIGASISSVVTEFIIAILTFGLVYKVAKLSPSLVNLAKVLGAGALMGLALFLVGSQNVILNVAVGGVVYVVALVVLRAVYIADLKELTRASKKDAA